MIAGTEQFTLVSGDDWHGLYRSGRLIAEGHRIQAQDVLDALGLPLDYVEADLEWLEKAGGLPKALREVRRA